MNHKYFKPLLILVAFGLGIYVALSPGIVYAAAPKVVLFFILSIIPAILFGSEVSARFKVTLPGFTFAVVGAGALFCGSLFLLDYLSKPEEKIAVFTFYDENGLPFQVDAPGLLRTTISTSGLTVTEFTKGNSLILIFPEQVSEVEISIMKFIDDKPYQGILSYAGTRRSKLSLGKELTQKK